MHYRGKFEPWYELSVCLLKCERFLTEGKKKPFMILNIKKQLLNILFDLR